MYHITLDPEVSPVVHAPRKVPIEIKDKLQAELNEMQSQGIITRVTQLKDWVNSLVIREKKKMGVFESASTLKTWRRPSRENIIRSLP